ncbi:MAG TPA: terminase family protein [Streptosporangiaceae bacterium]
MPWQQYVSDVILEIDPVTGLLVYDEYGMRVPRQSGKSTWVEAKSAHRCSATGFFGPRQHVVYTAQTRQKAREKWEEDFLFDLLASPAFKSRVRPHLGNGNEHIRFPNGSRWGLEAATEKAGHGPTIDNADIDEAFAHQDWRLEQAFGPAMITRLNKQLGWISTAGWLGGSPYLEEKSRIGQLAVLEGRDRGLAYFDWSAPEDADPGDETVWWACMPALGYTITVEAVRAEYRKALDRGKLNEFRRAYLNQWVPKDAPDAWQKFSEAVWKARADRGSRIAGRVALGFAVAPDRSSAAIAAAGRRLDGLGHGELVDHRDGTGWLVGRLLELAGRWDPCVLVMNPAGAAGAFEKPLLEHRFSTRPGPGERRLMVTGMREYAQACGALADDVVNGTWRHLGQQPLDDAAGSAGTRPLADAWAWSWKHSAADISPLEAVTLARHGFAAHGVGAAPEPEVF